jgi:prolipoprotein diacylglyceryl transferase
MGEDGAVIHALVPLFIPSPPTGIWYVFGFPLRAYALCIIAGIVVGMVIATRRWVARGGTSESLEMCVVVAVPAGIIGARLYHVITDYELYFGPDAPMTPIDALKIWHGGLGIWGAVALGVLGAYLVARRRKLAFPALLDATAPGIAVAQGIGRLGNWFNQELFGRPTTLPWGLEISPNYRPLGYEQYATFHPTFLYELVWCLLIALALVLLDRRFRLGHGKVFALYVVFYTLGRFWIEALRIDTVNRVGGFRLNNYTSLIVFVVALAWFLWLVKNRPGREEVVEPQPIQPAAPPSHDPEQPRSSDIETTEETDGAVKTLGTADEPHEPDESGHSDEKTSQPRVDDTERSGPAR